MKPLVYIAGPYTRPDPVVNTRLAITAAERVEALGADVFIPHLSLLWHLVSPAPVERWYERDNAVLDRCDALFRIPGDSTGADAEVERATELGLSIFDPVDIQSGELRKWVRAFIALEVEGIPGPLVTDPADRVEDLMAALADSVARAKEARRARHAE